jgi:hypothetical protein
MRHCATIPALCSEGFLGICHVCIERRDLKIIQVALSFQIASKETTVHNDAHLTSHLFHNPRYKLVHVISRITRLGNGRQPSVFRSNHIPAKRPTSESVVKVVLFRQINETDELLTNTKHLQLPLRYRQTLGTCLWLVDGNAVADRPLISGVCLGDVDKRKRDTMAKLSRQCGEQTCVCPKWGSGETGSQDDHRFQFTSLCPWCGSTSMLIDFGPKSSRLAGDCQ